MIRKVTVTKEKVPNILRSLSLIKIGADIAFIEHHQYLDADFRSPIAHQKLTQVRDNLSWVSGFLSSKFLVTKNPEVSDNMTFKLHEVMRMIMKLDEPALEELHENLVLVVKNIYSTPESCPG